MYRIPNKTTIKHTSIRTKIYLSMFVEMQQSSLQSLLIQMIHYLIGLADYNQCLFQPLN